MYLCNIKDLKYHYRELKGRIIPLLWMPTVIPWRSIFYEVFNKFSSNWSGATTAVLVLYTEETVRFGPEDKQLWLGESVLRAEYSLHLVTLLGLLFMGPMIPEHSETILAITP